MKAVFDNLIHLEHANIVKFHKYWADTKENRARVSISPAKTLTGSFKMGDIGLLLNLLSVFISKITFMCLFYLYYIIQYICIERCLPPTFPLISSSPSGDFHY